MDKIRNLSVSQLNGYIKEVFDDELILHNISVYGELIQLSVRDNATYFTITEGGSYINCVMFSALEKIELGTNVNVYGRVNFYSKTGKVSFAAKSVTVAGQGNKLIGLQKLKEQLKKEGLFENRLLPPVYISQAAVITSEAGAVIYDIMRVIRDRKAPVKIKLYPATVQGEGAANAIKQALERVNAEDGNDVVIIARGGGSNYDLDVFNDENLSRAVAASKVPVISAIGHEIDYTLCDFCSGRRAGTPSIAAAMVADINLSFLARLSAALQKIYSGVRSIYSAAVSRVYYNALGIVHGIDKTAETSRVRLSALNSRIYGGVSNLYSGREHSVKQLAAALESSSPLKTLSRGYAKATGENNEAIVGTDDLSVGQKIKLYFSDGSAKAEICEVNRAKR